LITDEDWRMRILVVNIINSVVLCFFISSLRKEPIMSELSVAEILKLQDLCGREVRNLLAGGLLMASLTDEDKAALESLAQRMGISYVSLCVFIELVAPIYRLLWGCQGRADVDAIEELFWSAIDLRRSELPIPIRLRTRGSARPVRPFIDTTGGLG